jgi:hypothetical protein
MKTIWITLFLFGTVYVHSQSSPFVGNYKIEHQAVNGVISYSLALMADGGFLFHSYRKLVCDSCVEENRYGKGKWISEKRIVSFLQEQVETNEINLNQAKARLESKSPRDISNRIVETKLLFYDADTPWLKGVKLIKIN